LVRVVASATNPVEAKIRANGKWSGIQLPAVIGYDAAGVVEALGPGVTEFQAGDAVYYTPEIFKNPVGTHAEYNVVPASIVAHKPKNLGFVEAAAVPLAAGTAYEAVVRRLRVALGETLLIHGAGGGVGSFAVQIAKALGARVLATAGTSNQALLRELGADVAIDYSKEDFAESVGRETGGQGVDAVFDAVGGDLVARSIPVTRAFGRLATILAPQGDVGGIYVRNQTLHGVFLTRERARLEALRVLIERNQVKPIIGEVLPLEDVQTAHQRLDSGHGRGKIVLRVSSE
jgi:NADPH2:quinone reductase